eukprot:g10048.t1
MVTPKRKPQYLHCVDWESVNTTILPEPEGLLFDLASHGDPWATAPASQAYLHLSTAQTLRRAAMELNVPFACPSVATRQCCRAGAFPSELRMDRTICLAMCGIFNFIYGILRNALWDDAAEATSGRFAQHLKYQAEESFSSGVVGPYLSWRFSYLLVGTFFGILSALLGMPWLINADYEAFLARQLPAGVPVARFRTLIQVLQGIDIAAWAILVLLAIGLALGGFWAMPSWAISNVRSSRRVVWCTWLIGFLPPFLLFLVLPLRGFVDWKGISADVCAQSVVSTYRMPGSQLHFTLQLLERNNVLEEKNGLSSLKHV